LGAYQQADVTTAADPRVDATQVDKWRWPTMPVDVVQLHDSRHFETLLDSSNTRKRVSSDSACSDKRREAALKAQGYQVDTRCQGGYALRR